MRAHFIADPEVDASDLAHLRELAPLRLHRLDVPGKRAEPTVPRLRIVSFQVLVALGTDPGRRRRLRRRGRAPLVGPWACRRLVLALIIAPIATELPEKFNSVIWVRQAKDTLALGNITGAMVFQSCIPTVVGLLLAADAWKRRPAVARIGAGVRLGRDRLPVDGA